MCTALSAFAAVIAAIAGCNCSSGTQAGPTYAPDAAAEAREDGSGGADAGREAGADASGEAPVAWPCHDLPPAPDPVPEGFPAGAKRLPALPPDIRVFEVPPTPTQLTWNSCGVGCKEIDTTWGPAGVPLYLSTRGGLVAGKGWLALSQRLAGGLMSLWIGPADGKGAQAFASIDKDYLTHSAAYCDGLSDRGAVVEFYGSKQLYFFGGMPGQTLTCLAKPAVGNPGVSSVYSDTRWAIASSATPILTGAWPVKTGAEDYRLLKTGDGLHDVRTEGAHLVFGGSGAQYKSRLWAWEPSQGARLLVAEDPYDNDCPAIDPPDMAWLRGEGRSVTDTVTWKNISLLRAATPFTSIPISGSVVRSLPLASMLPDLNFGCMLYAGFWTMTGLDLDQGWYAYLVRLSDGRLWKLPGREAGRLWRSVLYVTANEIALLEEFKGEIRTVVRYELASLGPGVPP